MVEVVCGFGEVVDNDEGEADFVELKVDRVYCSGLAEGQVHVQESIRRNINVIKTPGQHITKRLFSL